jgi:hypothetical protein
VFAVCGCLPALRGVDGASGPAWPHLCALRRRFAARDARSCI